MKHLLYIVCGCWIALACSTSVPDKSTDSDRLPKIYPDYIGVTVPVNIAPLTFQLDEQADEMIARYKAGDEEVVCAGKMQPSFGEWRNLTAAGGTISVDVYARHGSEWTHYKPFTITVSPDSIDPYLSYRLIPPSFVSYEALTISQRCLENYDESVIYDNMLCGFEKEGQCINCHHYQQWNPDRMQFHARQKSGGTVIAYDGKLKKVNMRNDSILSAGVYPAWHPWLNLIVYSTDKTHQSFHTTDPNKIDGLGPRRPYALLLQCPFRPPRGSAPFGRRRQPLSGTALQYLQEELRPRQPAVRPARAGVRCRQPRQECRAAPHLARRPLPRVHLGPLWLFPYLAPRCRPLDA